MNATALVGVPNGRTIRRRLMRSRTSVLWGKRAYLSVRIPMAMFPEPLPPRLIPGQPCVLDGIYAHVVGDVLEMYFVSELISGSVESVIEGEPVDGGRIARFVERDEHFGGDWISWYEGKICRFRLESPGMVPAGNDLWAYLREAEHIGDDEDIPVGMIAAERARSRWFARYIHEYPRDLEDPDGVENPRTDFDHPRKCLFWLVDSARSAWPAEVPGENAIHVQLGVKWFYPKRKLKFCAMMHRFMASAARAGFRCGVLW